MPTNLSLSQNPHTELIEHIEKYGGKLGVLELISKEYQKDPTPFDEIGIKVGPSYTPIIVQPGDEFTNEQYQDLLSRFGLTEDDGKELLIRGSLPGDYRGLIDVVPTEDVSNYDFYKSKKHPLTGAISENSYYRVSKEDDYDEVVLVLDKINKTIQSIRKRVKNISNRKFIGKYATLMGLPFQKNTLNFGIIPSFGTRHSVVTEHPNLEGKILEEEWKENTTRPVYSNIKNICNSLHGGNQVSEFLKLLRKKGILADEIAYSLELGEDSQGNTILYQIRELCRKLPVSSPTLQLKDFHNHAIHMIMTTIPIGESKIFGIDGSGNALDRNIEDKQSTPILGKYGCLSGLDVGLNPNHHGIMTESFKFGTLGGHDVMRQAQYALQSNGGGVVILGTDSYIHEMQLAHGFPEPKYGYSDTIREYCYTYPRYQVRHNADGTVSFEK